MDIRIFHSENGGVELTTPKFCSTAVASSSRIFAFFRSTTGEQSYCERLSLSQARHHVYWHCRRCEIGSCNYLEKKNNNIEISRLIVLVLNRHSIGADAIRISIKHSGWKDLERSGTVEALPPWRKYEAIDIATSLTEGVPWQKEQKPLYW